MSEWQLTVLAKIGHRLEGLTSNNQYLYYTTTTNEIWRVRKDNTDFPSVLVKTDQEKSNLRGIVWDGKNILFVCDWWLHRIWMYSMDSGSLSVLTGTDEGYQDGSLDEAQFCYPIGLTIDKNNNLYVTEDHHIRKINLEKRTVETVAGGPDSGWRDGPVMESLFSAPCGVAVSDGGAIYVTEIDNACVRQIHGIVSTFGKADQDIQVDGNLSEALFTNSRSLFWSPDGCLLSAEGDRVRVIDLRKKKVSSWFCRIGSNSVVFGHVDSNGVMFWGDDFRLARVENKWKWKRYLWIGKVKEDNMECQLARLPIEIIKEISSWI